MKKLDNFVPYGRHSIDDADTEAVLEVLRGDWLTGGSTVSDFERAVATTVNAKYAVACSSGTAALHLAALAAGIGEGDQAVVPGLTFLATANAVRYVGGDVVFADVEADTALMEKEQLLEAIKRADAGRLKAAFPVDIGGQTPDMPTLYAETQKHGILLIEDACHALGTSYRHDGVDYMTGCCQHSDMTVFSLHPVKTVAMGEGGVVTTNDEKLFQRLMRFRNHGMNRGEDDFLHPEMAFDSQGDVNPWYYEMTDLGFNYRVSDILCALGLSQLGKLKQFAERRAELVASYDRLIEPLAPLVKPLARNAQCQPAWHLYVTLMDFAAMGIERSQVMKQLRDRNIGTQVHYIPVNRQPYYKDRYGDIRLEGVETYYSRCLSLPLFPGIADDVPQQVVGALQEILPLDHS